MKRICFFSGDITRSGGTERVATMIANSLDQTGNYTILFLSLFEASETPFFAISPSVQRSAIYPAPTHGIQHYWTTCSKLKAFVKKQRVDTLIDIDCILDMYSLKIKKATGVRVISWEHFNFHQNPDGPYRKITRRWAARKADAIVTLTEADKTLYEQNLHLRCPIVAIPNPITFPAKPPKYESESTIILSCGRLTHQKGFDILVDVAAQVLPQHPDWKWLLLGEGEDRPMLEEKIVAAHLEKQLLLKGRIENISPYYQSAALFIMTSRFEGLPMVLLEAKAYRLPIVSFDCETGPAEMILDGVNGFLVQQDDVHTMSKRIIELIEDAEKRSAFSEHALDGTAKYLPKKIQGQWENLLRQ